MSLRKAALSGMVWAYTQQFGGQLISFVVSIFLARLILPAEFGLLGMISILVGIGTVLFTGGLSNSLIRTPNCTEEDYSTVFYFHFFVSLLIYITLFITSPWISAFYHQPRLTMITRVYGLTFLFSAFGTIQNTILTIKLNFRKQLIITIPSLLIGGTIGIITAYRHWGVWSLIVYALVQSFFTSLLLWLTSDWKPKWIFSRQKFSQHFHFGYKLTLAGILDAVFQNIYQIIMGRYYTAADVGYYNRANSLMMLPVGNVSGALNKVLFPLFARVQDDLPRFRNAYKQIMQIVLFIITPVIVIMGVYAKPIIILLFSDKWLPVVPIFQIICFSGVLYPLHSYNLLVLQIKGRSDLFLKLEVIKKILMSLILIISFFFGFYGLLWGQLIFSILALLINTHYAGKMLRYSMWSQLKDIMPIFLNACLMGLAVFAFDYFCIGLSDFFRLLIGLVGGIIVYLSLALIINSDTLNEIVKLIYKNDFGYKAVPSTKRGI